MKSLKKILLCFSLSVLFATGTQAQLNPTMYFMKDLPLNNQLNPAFQPKNGSIYVGLPGLNSIYANATLQGEGFTIGNLYLKPNYQAVADGSGQYGIGGGNVDITLLSFGFMVKDMYFSLETKVRVAAEGRITKDMEELFFYGNGDDRTIGRPLNMNGFGANTSVYSEVAVGFSKEILKDQLTVGGKVKYLQGIALADAGLGKGSYIETDPNNYNITVGINPDIYLSGLSWAMNVPDGVFTLDSLFDNADYDITNYKFDGGSRGVAFDLGGDWDLPWVKGLNVSASMLNIGFINWKGSKVTAVDPNSTFTFEGFDITNSDDFTSALTDSIMQATQVVSSSDSKRKWLHPTLYLGANYEVAKYFNVGALFGYQFAKYDGLPMFALSANTQNFMVNASASYSYYDSNHNLGLGLLFGRKGFQWHLIADNVIAPLIPSKTQQATVRTGFNMLFGKSKAKRKELAMAKINGDADVLKPTSQPKEVLNPVQQEGNTGTKVEGSNTPASTKSNVEPAPQVQVNAETATSNDKTSQTQKSMSKEELKKELLKKAMEEELADEKATKKK